MIRHCVPSPLPDPELVRSLQLTVRPLPHRPHRWAWDLKDGRDSSWFESMWEFDSEERARRSGLSRILELSRSVRGETVAASRIGEHQRHIVIVSRHDDDLYGLFTGAFGGSESVKVIRDRRRSSAKMDGPGLERRSTDLAAAIRARGWAIVCLARSHGGARLHEAA